MINIKLVIVESPSKTKTIENFLGKDYKVVSSKGHIRDLATTGKYGLGVDLEDDFKPTYKVAKGKSPVVRELKKVIKNASHVYLATDPDREGEAISFHLFEELNIDEEKYNRIIFNEITKDAVLKAFDNPGKLDDDLVKSQETRRILDRIIGFRLSKLMQSKTGGKSAGRVQSVAVKLIVDREREIEAFIPDEYWKINAIFKDFDSELTKYKNKKIELKNEKDADKVLNNLNDEFIIEEIKTREVKRKSYLPFITSTLQQTASSIYRFSPSKTMMIAQKLYEGINIGNETVGLISYMRTDSSRLSNEFTAETFKYIEDNYGKDYKGFRRTKTKDNTKDAHEAIRPTSILREPEEMKKYLKDDEYKIYNLIYKRALASLMKDANTLATTILFDNNQYEFRSTGSTLIFDGFLKVYGEFSSAKDKFLPDLKDIKELKADEVEKTQHFTKPKARYTEASLIKELEELGIGRPSTYSNIITTITKRNYAKLEKRRFYATDSGKLVTDSLDEFFSNIINVEYTANMEADLDKIASKEVDNVKVLKDFYNKFEPLLDNAFENMEKKETEKTGEKCPECGGDLVIRNGRYGEFVACSNFPKCKYIKQEKPKIIMDCPKCEDGNIVEKRTRRGKIFYGCDNYPKCDYAVWDKPTGELCPDCENLLVEKKDKIKCSNCSYEKES